VSDSLDLKVGISGVRGVVGQGLTAQVAFSFARAFAAWAPGSSVAIGRDTRTSGEMLRAAVVAGLLESGKHVVDLGILPVPSLQTAIRLDDELHGGLYISASHNPGEYNGLKFFRADGIILYPQQAEELIALWAEADFPAGPLDRPGTLSVRGGAIDQHIQRVVDLVDVALIEEAELTVVLDSNNGAGCYCGKELLRHLGVAEMDLLNPEATGVFAHTPEPIPEHMGQLAERVAQLGYHIGFSQDPDADRVSIACCVGPDGRAAEAIGEEFTLALGAASVAAQAAGRGHTVSMACNYSTSRMIEDIAAEHGFPFRRTAVGEINVVEGLQALEREWDAKHPGDAAHFAFGGEGGGGIIDPRNQYCRDSLNSVALILQGLAQWKLGRALPDAPRPDDGRLLCDSWRKVALMPCAIVKDKMTFDDIDRQDGVMEAAMKRYGKADVPPEDIATNDGVRVRYPDRSWLHIRPSNTEPIVRFIAEHDSEPQARRLVDEAMEVAKAALQ